MPIVSVRLPDGQIVKVEVPEQAAETPSGAPEELKKPLASFAAGAGQMMTGLAKLPVDLTRLAEKGLNRVGFSFNDLSPALSQEKKARQSAQLSAPNWLDNMHSGFSRLQKEEGVQGTIGAAIEGAGGGSPYGVPGMLAGAVSNVVQKKVGESFGEIPGAVAGMVSGGLTGMATSPSALSYAQNQVKQAAGNLTPQQIADAVKNRDLFRRTGAKTATLPELFEGKTSLKGLALETAAARGGEQLQARLANREQDLQDLTDTLLRRTGANRVNVNEVANKTVDAANRVVKDMEGTRSAGTAAHFRTSGGFPAELPAAQVKGFAANLRSAGQMEARPEARAAYEELASALERLTQNRTAATIQDLSGTLKGFKDNPVGANASAATKWADGDMKDAVRYAEQILAGQSPHFASGMKFFGDYTKNVVDPAKEGIIGAVRETTPHVPKPSGSARIAKVLADQEPGSINKSVALLTQAGADPRDMLAATLANKLRKGSTDPAKDLYGIEGSLDQRNLLALGQNARMGPSFLDPARAASKLQGLQNQPTRTNDQLQSTAALFAQPFATIKNKFNQAAREKNYAEIAEILKDPANLEALQQIAANDPSMRRMLTTYSAIVPLMLAPVERK